MADSVTHVSPEPDLREELPKDHVPEGWEPLEIEPWKTGLWRLGPIRMYIRRSPSEWRFTHGYGEDRHDDSFEWIYPVEPESVEEEGLKDPLRAVSDSPSNQMVFTPRLADRTIVVRPETALRVLPRAVAKIYVSSPLWVAVQVGDPPQHVLDLPSWPLPDTWFGPSTTHGELCYAIKAIARLHLDNLPRPKHRAITQMHVENRSSESVVLERMALPIPNLSLYVGDDGRYWTQSVSVRLTDGGGSVEVDLRRGPPEEAGAAIRIAAPREHVQRNIFLRARHALFT